MEWSWTACKALSLQSHTYAKANIIAKIRWTDKGFLELLMFQTCLKLATMNVGFPPLISSVKLRERTTIEDRREVANYGTNSEGVDDVSGRSAKILFVHQQYKQCKR
jgi:hypothetical protein